MDVHGQRSASLFSHDGVEQFSQPRAKRLHVLIESECQTSPGCGLLLSGVTPASTCDSFGRR